MKSPYETAQILIVNFESRDVITTSDIAWDDDENQGEWA